MIALFVMALSAWFFLGLALTPYMMSEKATADWSTRQHFFTYCLSCFGFGAFACFAILTTKAAVWLWLH